MGLSSCEGAPATPTANHLDAAKVAGASHQLLLTSSHTHGLTYLHNYACSFPPHTPLCNCQLIFTHLSLTHTHAHHSLILR